MKEYFQLQWKMFNRHLIDFGITPFLAYPILILIFVFASNALFERVAIASYVLPFFAIIYFLKLGGKIRNDFLRISFSSKKYKQIRILENLLISFPFVVFLVYKSEFLIALVLLIVAVVFSFIKTPSGSNITIPTLFKKHPFEFTEGFRKTLYMFPIAGFLTYISIEVNNFNLGVFAIVAVFLVCISYNTKTEENYFVWMFKKSPTDFLRYKIKVAIISTSLLMIPFLIILGIFYPEYIHFLVLIHIVGCFYLAQFVIAKYADFPRQINFPIAIILLLSISFPPNLLFTFPYLYKKAIQKLSIVLHD